MWNPWGRQAMEMRLIHTYPDLMNLYGSYANVLVLQQFLEDMGYEVTVEKLEPGEERVGRRGDLVYMGAGTEHSARAAMGYLEEGGLSGWLKEAARDGAVLFFAGTAMELLGREIRERDGTVYQGLGLADFITEHVEKRMVGDVYGHTVLCPEAVVGFMNKSARIKGVGTPLLCDLELGWGNETYLSPEGFHQGNLFASELTGPLLVKNPHLLEVVVAAICARQGQKLPEDRTRDSLAWEAYRATAARLQGRLWQKPGFPGMGAHSPM